MDYGFVLPDSVDRTFYEQFKIRYSIDLERRKRRWNSVKFKNHNEKPRSLKRFIRKGIPPELRPELWMKYSGAEERMNSNSDLYKQLLDTELDSSVNHVIISDINRTYPNNPYFQKLNCSNNQKNKLKNILTAFAAKNPSIGYCQGLNYIAAIIILIISNEEKCFWLLDTIIMTIAPQYYSPGMKSVMIDGLVLEELLRLKASMIYKNLKKMDTTCIAMCTKWFICLFVDVLPIETALRVMDCFIYEGEKILFRVALGIIKLNSKQFIKATTFPEFAMCFRNIVSNELAVDCHLFLQDLQMESQQNCENILNSDKINNFNVFKLSDPLSFRKIKKLRKICEGKLSEMNLNT